ncbi:MAG: preprotein translocase subunit SecG [Alphaproteobacteria bacterium]|nr:preprotein translocase subunit SecG [Alphaproteobacteria bacterium]
MIILLLVIHMFIAIALVGVILLQKSEGGALGMGGGGMSGFMTGRSTANLLTRTTAILAAAFMLTSIVLVVLSNRTGAPHSILEGLPASNSPLTAPATPGAPLTTPATPPAASTPPEPANPGAPTSTEPAQPTAPLAR